MASLEKEKVSQILKQCLCFCCMQIDGIADKHQVGSKFITARFVPAEEVSVKTVYLGIASSRPDDAYGLLDISVVYG